MRAVYGGFGLAIAGLLLVPYFEPALHDGITLSVAVALFGMAGGRVISALFDRPGLWPVVFFFVELAGGFVLLAA